MRLKISGIGKIGDSEIEMNGITVIAGDNNTGKSTFGKVLYCMFNSFCDAEDRILNERTKSFYQIIRNALRRIPASGHYFNNRTLIKRIEEMKNTNIEDFSEDNIREIIMDTIPEQFISEVKEDNTWFDELVNSLKQSLSVGDEEIQKTIIGHYFGREFERTLNHVNKPNSTGNISLIIQGKNVNVNIKHNVCSDFDKGIYIDHKAIYMDTPFIMDDIEEPRAGFPSGRFLTIVSNPPVHHKQNLCYRLAKKYSNNTIIEEVITNKKITNKLSNLYSITNGELLEDTNGVMFLENGLKEPIPLPNVSAGIKTFLVIRRLLELGEIKERDVLILDEPEIHLHPSWQLQFAEILVLLQKEFNLTILIATHSPYFLNAIETYGKRHGITEQVKFYLAENNGDISNVRDVTNSIDAIYKQLAIPFETLDAIDNED